MARMLGRSYLWKRDTRWHKRREARQAGRETRAEWRDRADRAALEADLAAQFGERGGARWPAALALLPMEPGDAAEDALGECRHGCNGDDIASGYPSERCTWQCHPGLDVDPEQAARHELMMAETTADDFLN